MKTLGTAPIAAGCRWSRSRKLEPEKLLGRICQRVRERESAGGVEEISGDASPTGERQGEIRWGQHEIGNIGLPLRPVYIYYMPFFP